MRYVSLPTCFPCLVNKSVAVQLSPTESPSASPPPRQTKASPSKPKPKLKLTLRLPFHPQNATPTPSDEQPLPPSSGRRASNRTVAPDIESEDDEDEDESSSRSASYAGPSRMTHRQAALKGFVEPTEHVALGKYLPPSTSRLHQ